MIALHLVQTPLRLRAFTKWALGRGFLRVPPGDGTGRPREPDPGYALHAALAGLLGERAPRPFSLPAGEAGRRNWGSASDIVPVLGYSELDGDGLATLAQVAKDEFQELFDCDGLRAKPLPTRWPQGLRLGFDLRACPVRRRKADLPFATNIRSTVRETVTFSGGGKEVDAFQLATVRAEQQGKPTPRRDEVYAEWLRQRFVARRDDQAPLSLVEGSVRIRSYRSTRLLRRPRNGNGRSPCWLTRPDVWFSGQVTVTDGSAVPRLLAGGIGRHSGFGFGMMLLRPA